MAMVGRVAKDGFPISLTVMCSMLKVLLLSVCAFPLQPSPTAHLSLSSVPFFHGLSLSVIPGDRHQKNERKKRRTMTMSSFFVCMLFLLFQPSQQKDMFSPWIILVRFIRGQQERVALRNVGT